jgi:hypothetical protein
LLSLRLHTCPASTHQLDVSTSTPLGPRLCVVVC